MMALFRLLDLALDALSLLIVVNALLSWFQPNPYNPVVRFIDRVSDALCDPLRRAFPTVVGGLDLAPMVVLLLIMVVRRFVLPLLFLAPGGR
jgi:YggT family protein